MITVVEIRETATAVLVTLIRATGLRGLGGNNDEISAVTVLFA